MSLVKYVVKEPRQKGTISYIENEKAAFMQDIFQDKLNDVEFFPLSEDGEMGIFATEIKIINPTDINDIVKKENTNLILTDNDEGNNLVVSNKIIFGRISNEYGLIDLSDNDLELIKKFVEIKS